VTPHTGIAALDWVLSLLDGWGYLLVVLFTILENLFIIGSFTPGETIVMAAGFLTVKGHLDVRLVFACSIIGTVTGSNISYFFGRKGGRQALERYGGRLVDAERILAAEEYFERHGPKTVLIARFAAVFKNFVPVIAGASRMRIVLFEAYTLAGALAYTTLMVVLGRVFGENFDQALAIARDITWAGLVLLLGMLAALWLGRRRYLRAKVEALAKEAEKEAAKDAEPQG
jgi:membrane-associated protein